MIRKQFDSVVKASSPSSATFALTTEDIDRDGEICLASGADFTDYNGNPIWMWGHDHGGPPSSTIGNGKNWRQFQENGCGGILVDVDFDIEEGPESMAAIVAGKVHRRVLRAVSIGFIPTAYLLAPFSDEIRDALDLDAKEARVGRKCTCIYTKYSVLEGSCVHIPANQVALLRAAGFDSDYAYNLATYLAKELKSMAVPTTTKGAQAPPEVKILDADAVTKATAELQAAEATLKACQEKLIAAGVTTLKAPDGTVSTLLQGPEVITATLQATDVRKDMFSEFAYQDGYGFPAYGQLHPQVADYTARLYTAAKSFPRLVDPKGEGTFDKGKAAAHCDCMKDIHKSLESMLIDPEDDPNVDIDPEDVVDDYGAEEEDSWKSFSDQAKAQKKLKDIGVGLEDGYRAGFKAALAAVAERRKTGAAISADNADKLVKAFGHAEKCLSLGKSCLKDNGISYTPPDAELPDAGLANTDTNDPVLNAGKVAETKAVDPDPSHPIALSEFESALFKMLATS